MDRDNALFCLPLRLPPLEMEVNNVLQRPTPLHFEAVGTIVWRLSRQIFQCKKKLLSVLKLSNNGILYDIDIAPFCLWTGGLCFQDGAISDADETNIQVHMERQLEAWLTGL